MADPARPKGRTNVPGFVVQICNHVNSTTQLSECLVQRWRSVCIIVWQSTADCDASGCTIRGSSTSCNNELRQTLRHIPCINTPSSRGMVGVHNGTSLCRPQALPSRLRSCSGVQNTRRLILAATNAEVRFYPRRGRGRSESDVIESEILIRKNALFVLTSLFPTLLHTESDGKLSNRREREDIVPSTSLSLLGVDAPVRLRSLLRLPKARRRGQSLGQSWPLLLLLHLRCFPPSSAVPFSRS